ncbi:SsrA-binding protein SmpB [Catalinimonas niigatensis]|uniref:SsrA-binding protein SmpB n=1 Tax=Catalinimonas niigatensis TaxID=1397264 RepID=UPI002666A282|nr:SsrA-binding protein SmpB [Catalinimonas niigatensis]WPP50238.1 SsrA-binding protein SmpB [Catalinimonas niigatensis]
MAKNEKQRFANKININNRKASYEYHFLDKYIAGIQLRGTEIKSIREGKVNLQEGFCYMKGGELFVKQMHISPYAQGTHYNHVSDRERKLLLTKKELEKIASKSEEKGLTMVPTRLFINDRGLAKLEFALAKGKKLYDKRDDIKQKDVKRELDRMHI